MGGARAFVPRAPRYEYQDLDPKILRFSTDKNIPLEAFIANLSLTGVAFYVHNSVKPELGSTLKVELSLPTAIGEEDSSPKKIAWYGKVVRFENKKSLPWWLNQKSSEVTIIGIRFVDLPVAYSQVIQKTLDECWTNLRKQRWRKHWKKAIYFYTKRTTILAGYGILLWSTYLFFKHFTQPDADYDASRGSPWGKRFQINKMFDK